MIKSFVLSLAVAGMAWTACAAETALNPADFSTNKPKSIAIKGDTITVNGSYVLLSSKKTFKNVAGKKYGIKGTFKALPNTPNSMVYIGFMPVDAKGQEITHISAVSVPNTVAKLTQPVKPADKVLKVTDASKWVAKGAVGVVYKAAANGSDIPNRNIAKGNVVKVEKKNGFWEITMDRPVGFTAKAGEMIREHRYGGYIYVSAVNTQKGIVDCKGTSNIYFKGAAAFRVVVLGNWSTPKKGENFKMEVKNVRLFD